jgi:soluble lytic murein transglycosylase
MPRGPILILIVTLAGGPWPLGLHAQSAPLAADALVPERAEFLDALAALASPERDTPADSDALRGYALYPYVEAARIREALSDTSGALPAADASAAVFLARHAGEPVGEELRAAWLGSLGRRADWGLFLVHYRGTPDRVLQCQALQARIATESPPTEELTRSIEELWLTPRRLPAECEPVFDWYAQQELLTPALIEQRVRALLDAGEASFARVIAGRLPAERALPLLRWADLIETPAKKIAALIAAPHRATEMHALLDGWRRWSRTDPAAARESFATVLRSWEFNAAQRSQLALALALGFAWDRQASEALELFERVASADLDDYALGWQTRAALWAGEWQLVQESIEAMSEPQREQSRWRYWAARAAGQTGQPEQAKALYESLLSTDNYYAALAAARLARAVSPHPEHVSRDSVLVNSIAAQPAFVRARELLLVGLADRAVAEWQHGFASLQEAERTQSIHLAADWNWHDVVVATSTRLSVFNAYGLLYPQPYAEFVESGAQRSGLEPTLLYGLMRQESLFRADAGSAAGALGLMQLMPDTARRTAQLAGLPAPHREDLFDPQTNITLGAAHLRSLVDRFNGHLVVALAGYNAGSRAAERWLPERPLDSDIWVENIPYNETREYVQRVLWHSIVFAWLRNGEGQSADAWLAHVQPLDLSSLVGQR